MKLKIHNRTQLSKHFLPLPQKKVDKFLKGFCFVNILSKFASQGQNLNVCNLIGPIWPAKFFRQDVHGVNVSEFETHNPRFSQLKTGTATSYQGPSLVIAFDGRLIAIVRKIPEFN